MSTDFNEHDDDGSNGTKNPKPNEPSQTVKVSDQREVSPESMMQDTCYCFSDVSEIREFGDWTLVDCKCNNSMASSATTTETASSIGNDHKLICTCQTLSNIPTDSLSNCSSSDVAVINESDQDVPSETELNDLDGISRISSLNLTSLHSPLTSITDSVKTSDDNYLDSKRSSNSSSRLRLRLKKASNNSDQKSGLGEIIARRISPDGNNYKRSLKKITKRIFITNEGILTLDRTTIIVAILCLIILFFSVLCLFFAFISKTSDKIELSSIKVLPLSQIEDSEKEFLDCLKSNQKEQDCGRNLKLWKNSLSELLSKENERILNLILKLEEINEISKSSKTVVKEMDKSENFKPTPDVDKNIYSRENTKDSEKNSEAIADDNQETVESLRNQMEELENLYNLEKSKSLYWENLFQETVLEKERQTPINQESQRPLEVEVEEEREASSNDYLNGVNNFFPNYDAVWKGLKNTANNLNPHLEKFRVKLSKVIKDNVKGARQLGDKLRKKLVKNTEKLSKKLEKLRKAWNEEDNCETGSCDSNTEREKAQDSLNKLRDEAQWYTKRLKNLDQSRFLSRDDEDLEDESNWMFRRAKYREEKHGKPSREEKKKKI